MIGAPSRHEKLQRLATVALVIDLIGSCVAVGYGLYQIGGPQGAALGLGFVIGGLAGMLIGILLYCQVLLINKFVNYSYRAYDTLLETYDLLRRQEEHSHTIADNSNLSEWAKRVVHREKDYEFLRDTIQSAIVRQDWPAALHLISDMETEFGYHDEARQCKERLDQARKATTKERVAAVLARFELLCDQRKWDQALAECGRLTALFPDNTTVASLPEEIEERRSDVKRKLLKEYDEALQKQELDHAHQLLFQIDQYILPREAAALRESARDVFRARLEQIRTKFSIAVSYKQFRSAVEAGEQLIREFPNSGYAQEISKLLPILRQRAGSQRSHSRTASS